MRFVWLVVKGIFGKTSKKPQNIMKMIVVIFYFLCIIFFALKTFYNMQYIIFRLLKTARALEKNKNFNQFFSLIFFYIIDDWFFINIKISTECEFEFLNTTIIKVWLIYLFQLNFISFCNQKPPFFSLEGLSWISSKFISAVHSTILYWGCGAQKAAILLYNRK